MQNGSFEYSRWIRSYLKKYWYLLLFTLLISLVGIVLQLASPLPMKFLADYVFGEHRPPELLRQFSKQQLLLYVSLFYVGLGVSQYIFGILSGMASQKMRQVFDKHAMLESFDASNLIPANHPNRVDNGTYLYQITTQSQQLSEYTLTNFSTISESIITMLGVLIILSRIDLRMTLISLGTIPPLILSLKYFGERLEKKALAVEISHAKVYDFIGETLSNLRTVQTFAKEKIRLVSLSKLITDRNKKANSRLVTSQLFGISTGSIILVAVTVALISGGQSAISGTITFGDLLLFIAYMDNVFDPLTSIVGSFGSMREQKAALNQVHQTLTASKNLKLNTGSIKDVAIQGSVDLKNVSYSIGGQTIFDNINLSIPSGTITAFVGPSGQGKSTLLNMLIRMVEPTRGFVLIDGRNVNDYDVHFLRESIATIEQEPNLFNTSVLDNVALAHPDEPFNLPDVMGASYISNAVEFVEKLPEKYDTIIDNERLSGGQKQRIAAARAYYKKSPIIIMDEPTSALDDASVKLFVENIFKYLKGRTIMMVTHDLSLLEHINNIYVVSGGHIKPISEYGGLEAYKDKIK